MALQKTPNADLRQKYGLYLQVGFIVSLLTMVSVFKLSGQPAEIESLQITTQEIFKPVEIDQTTHFKKPPPPPRPPAPVEVANDEPIPDDALDFDIPDFEDPVAAFIPQLIEEPDETIEPFIVVEDMPEIIGGLKALYAHIDYPEMAKRVGLEGRVVVQFVIDKKGNLINPEIVSNPLGAGLEEEAIRALKAVQFSAGRQRGVAVPVRMSIPITFRLR